MGRRVLVLALLAWTFLNTTDLCGNRPRRLEINDGNGKFSRERHRRRAFFASSEAESLPLGSNIISLEGVERGEKGRNAISRIL
jgi:hypothetical protein